MKRQKSPERRPGTRKRWGRESSEALGASGMEQVSRPKGPGKRLLGGPKRDRKSITLHVKLEVLRRFEEGEKLTQIAKTLGLATSTVASIRVNKERIKASSQAAAPISATQLTRCRGVVMGNMERLLSLWIEDQKRRQLPVNTVLIQEKAKSLFEDLKRKHGDSAQTETFGASNGWFARFKARHNVLLTDEPAVADAEAARKYPDLLRKIIEEGGYTPQQVFNVDETGLFWKRLPERTFVTLEDKVGPGFKASKDHLTLLLGGNAAGDCKLKPLLVYPSENPRALKGCFKPNLPVIWRSNRNDWVTVSIFQEWFTDFFCPAVERHCAENKLPNKALLLLDGAPCHPVYLDDLSANVRVQFLPKNTSALIQPMNQGVITTFKAFYLKRTLCQLLEETHGEEKPTVREFWRSYTIMTAVDNIAEAWRELKPATMNAVWKKVWPECVLASSEAEALPQIHRHVGPLADHGGLDEAAEDDVVRLFRAPGQGLMQLAGEVGLEDAAHFLHSHRAEEELLGMPGPGMGHEDPLAPSPELTAKHLAEALSHFDRGLQILTDNDPDRERSLKACCGVNGVIRCYRELYKEKKREAK
ncbi:tigger transposable element-derived protein 1-like [Gracilinanus agilis]|uniref:tigger transposable element-derived protein 1-like n=1 Tax=Gracilinanus agilis TaxID=191870 RepID=UPI001CFE5BBD|nr:tigger transposable element-derived protein 1-like [Gracilinanus agilis]XP_044522958.1 tigger transposable element-derived protein 1-like [Gracilinanus agilis]